MYGGIVEFEQEYITDKLDDFTPRDRAIALDAVNKYLNVNNTLDKPKEFNYHLCELINDISELYPDYLDLKNEKGVSHFETIHSLAKHTYENLDESNNPEPLLNILIKTSPKLYEKKSGSHECKEFATQWRDYAHKKLFESFNKFKLSEVLEYSKEKSEAALVFYKYSGDVSELENSYSYILEAKLLTEDFKFFNKDRQLNNQIQLYELSKFAYSKNNSEKWLNRVIETYKEASKITNSSINFNEIQEYLDVDLLEFKNTLKNDFIKKLFESYFVDKLKKDKKQKKPKKIKKAKLKYPSKRYLGFKEIELGKHLDAYDFLIDFYYGMETREDKQKWLKTANEAYNKAKQITQLSPNYQYIDESLDIDNYNLEKLVNE